MTFFDNYRKTSCKYVVRCDYCASFMGDEKSEKKIDICYGCASRINQGSKIEKINWEGVK